MTKSELRRLVNTLPMGVLWLDRASVVREANDAAREILGCAELAELDRTYHALGGDDAGAADGSEAAGSRVDERVIGARVFEVTAVPDRAESGDLLGTLVVFTEITQRRQVEELQHITNSILELLTRSLSLEESLQIALDRVLSTRVFSLQAGKGAVFLADANQPEVLRLQVSQGFPEQQKQLCARVPYGHCLCGRAAAENLLVAASHVDHRHDIRYEGMSHHGHYCVPIASSTTTYGVLNVYVDGGHRETEVEQTFLTAVSRALAGLIERKRLEDQLTVSATVDFLTGVPNRMLFRERLGNLLRWAEREEFMVGILFLDLDDLKWVNDNLGHAAGDDLLRGFARRIQGCLRASDTVGRLGGDEFAVMAKVASAGDVSTLVEKLRACSAEPLALAGRPCRVGVSLGVAMYPVDGTEVDALLTRADERMYREKKARKNDPSRPRTPLLAT